MKYSIFLLLFLLSFSFTANTQPCGNVADKMDIERLLSNRTAMENGISVRNGVTVYVPITFHIVSAADGTGGITEDKIDEQLCRLNQDYADLEMVFYLKDKTYNYVSHDPLFTSPTSSSGGTRMVIEKASAGANSINVFITQNANTGGLGTTLGYYDPSLDLIVMRKDQINATSGTLPHELGHFFSLLHVFNGWDFEEWNQDIHGSPVNSQFSPGGVQNELVDGSNCSISGDFLCDTPADYNLGFSWPGCTEYTGPCKDFNGESLKPQEENYMSYFIGCDQYVFSEMQQDIILEDYNSPARNFLKVGYVPNTDLLGDVQITGPDDGATTSTYNDVVLDWEDVDNAIGYVVSIKRLISEFKYFTTNSYLNPGELEVGKKYTWRVMPVGEVGGCASFTEFREFTTGTVASNNQLELQGITLKNSLVSNGNILFESDIQSNFTIQVYNVSGQIVEQSSQIISEGLNSYEMTGAYNTGMYFVRLIDQSTNSAKTFKIVSTK